MGFREGNTVEVMDPTAEVQPQKNYRNISWEAAFKDSMIRKRLSPYSTLTFETQNEQLQKVGAIEKDGKRQRVATAQVIEKVSDVFDCSGVRSSELSSSESSDSDACSVGSCSVNYRSQDHYRPSQESDDLCSDAESCCGSGSPGRVRNSFHSQEDVETNIHRVELQAYRSTLEALYASGPISWEQEALLTNLRITLNISNDEQLIELRSLISAKTATHEAELDKYLKFPAFLRDTVGCISICFQGVVAFSFLAIRVIQY